VHDVVSFGGWILLVSSAIAIALFTTKLTERLSIPAAAPFLVAAAAASDLFPSLEVSTDTVVKVATVALIVILFDGGLGIGWHRFRGAIGPISALGVAGTFATAWGATMFGHWGLGLGWTTAGLLGAAVAPTDPAVMFSVLGEREVAGRSGTILEGESGANDPVGIALMIGMVEFATHANASFWIVVREFLVAMSVGLAVGVVGGLLIGQALRRVTLPSSGLYSLQGLAGAGIVYGAASVAHGSGFLAVFVAGLLVGSPRAAFRVELGVFQEALSSLSEIVVFGVLGLNVTLSSLDGRVWRDGLLLAAVVALLVRPIVVVPLLAPARLTAGERAFVAWGGLKGAVPILLAAFVVQREIAGASRIYDLVFVVVLASVLVQGSTIPLAARRLGIRMRRIGPRSIPGDE
jgi:cell volume regulation protein A